MSTRPKYSSTDGHAAERCETTFFIWDEKDGKVAVEATEHPEFVAWPRQVLRVTGANPVTPPLTLMTAQEFAAWRESLDAAGFDFDVRFK